MSKTVLATALVVIAAIVCLAGAGTWFAHYRSHGYARDPEANAIGFLRTVTTAQALFREGDKDKNSVLDYAASLDDLIRVGYIAPPRRCRFPLCGHGGESYDDFVSYRFRVLAGTQFTWSMRADPVPGRRGADRSFFVDESGVIRFSATGPATAKSMAIGG